MKFIQGTIYIGDVSQNSINSSFGVIRSNDGDVFETRPDTFHDAEMKANYEYDEGSFWTQMIKYFNIKYIIQKSTVYIIFYSITSKMCTKILQMSLPQV